MLPVKGIALFDEDTIQFGGINKDSFLKISHRFKNKIIFGNIMRMFRIGNVTDKAIQCIITRYEINSNAKLLPLTKICCACYRNDKRNAFNSVVFQEHLKATHRKSNNPSTECPTHT